MGTAEEAICRFVSALQWQDIPEAVKGCARRCFTDTMACIISGGKSVQFRAAEAVIDQNHASRHYLAGQGLEQVNLYDSVLLNACAAHSEEYNDLFFGRPGHPSAVLVPVVLGLGFSRNASASSVMESYVAGLEVMALVNLRKLLKDYGKPEPILGMEDPYYYRNKVHATYKHMRNGDIAVGRYEESSHRLVPIESCQIEDQKADEVIQTIRKLAKSFKIKIFNEDSGYGLLRHVLIRTGRKTGEMLVVLVVASPVFPSKNNFVKALRKEHPEITSIVLNINDKKTSMILGERNIVLYGKGYIQDELCGYTFRISPHSFYQVNPVQTERLYKKAIRLADLKRKEKVLDAYCGIGTIGMIASKQVKEVIGVELNRDAVRDAIGNAKGNGVKNIRFYQADAGEFMVAMAEQGEKMDVVFMDPPRAGSDEAFLQSVIKLAPKKVVYISCNPETLARDLGYLTKKKYKVTKICPVDMFPFTDHCEVITCLQRVES